MDKISEQRLAEVTELAKRVRAMAAALLAIDGVEIRVTEGYRSFERQAELYAKGRNEHGEVVNAALVITKAKPGRSWHQYKLAVDVVPDDAALSGFQADWNASHPVWQKVVEAGISAGLEAGAKWRTFPDFPHFQLPGLASKPPDVIVATLQASGVPAAWKVLGLEVA